MIYFDKFSEIGSTHKENQDYAVIGDEESPFIIVADGCSSSKNSAIGARVLSLCMAKSIREHRDIFDLNGHGLNAITQALSIVENLRTGKESLDCTLMVAIVQDDSVIGKVWGDGLIFVKDRQGVRIADIRYEPEMPYYLSYKVDQKRDDEYFKMLLDGSVVKREYRDGADHLGGSPMQPYDIQLSVKNIEYIILATDGASSFQKENTDIPQEEINEQITSFKRLNGEFIGRRMNRMVKSNAKQGIKHYDDLTIAGMSFVD